MFANSAPLCLGLFGYRNGWFCLEGSEDLNEVLNEGWLGYRISRFGLGEKEEVWFGYSFVWIGLEEEDLYEIGGLCCVLFTLLEHSGITLGKG